MGQLETLEVEVQLEQLVRQEHVVQPETLGLPGALETLDQADYQVE